MDNERAKNMSRDEGDAPPCAEHEDHADIATLLPDSASQARTLVTDRRRALLLMAFYGLGLATGYLAWGRPTQQITAGTTLTTAAAAVGAGGSPPSKPLAFPVSYTIPATFNDIGPQLLASGAIDYDRFVALYQRRGRPLTDAQIRILQAPSDQRIMIDWDNEYFLLNLFWAVGLVNANTILTEGPMTQYADGDVGGFASTGGWTIGAQPASDLFASASIIPLTAAQQTRLEEVAAAVYRPCCNNPTSFPDCNHGMAMLGLLQLMAGQGASVEEMFVAAKQVNTFWFPQQTAELALFSRHALGQEFDEVEARLAVGFEMASAAGFAAVHEWLRENGHLDESPSDGSRCGV